MDFSPRLSLPLLMPQQASKHITHNEALMGLDVLVQPVVASRTLGTPPETPLAGEAFIVGSSASGAWAGHASEIALFQNGGWVFHDPAEGWQAYVVDSAEFTVFQGGVWMALAGNGPTGVPMLGINAAADTSKRLRRRRRDAPEP